MTTWTYRKWWTGPQAEAEKFLCASPLSSYRSQLLRSWFTRDKNLSVHNLTTNFLVNILIYIEKSSVRNRYHSFLFMCTLHWWKHCTEREVAPNWRIFSLTDLYGAEGDGVVWSSVQVGTLFVPTLGLHFQALLPYIFLCGPAAMNSLTQTAY